MHVDGVFTREFIVKSALNKVPYSTCLLDISEGIPCLEAIKNFGLLENYQWEVDPIDFYKEARNAKAFSLKKTFSELDRIASSNADSKCISVQSKVLMWKAEQQMKDDKVLSDMIDRLESKKLSEELNSGEKSALKTLGYSDEPGSDSYYAKYGTH